MENLKINPLGSFVSFFFHPSKAKKSKSACEITFAFLSQSCLILHPMTARTDQYIH
jgi:hypothetical protein